MRRSSCSTHLRECHWSTPRAGSRCLLRGPLALGSDTQVSPVTMSLMEPYGSLWVMLHPQSPKHWPRVTKTSLELVLQQQRFKDQLYCSTPTSKDVERLVSAINWVPKTGTLFYMLRQCKTLWLEVLSTEILTNVCVCFLCLQHSIYCRFLFQHQE